MCRGVGGWIRQYGSRVPQRFAFFFTAIGNRMVTHGRNDMAFFLLMTWSSYVRRNHLSPLQTQSHLKPGWRVFLIPIEEGVASQTNEYDFRVALDHERWVDFLPLLRTLKRRKAEKPVWQFTCPEYVRASSQVSKPLTVASRGALKF